jgi:hypothetical protein
MQTNKGLHIDVNINMSRKGTKTLVETPGCKGTHTHVSIEEAEAGGLKDSKLFVVWIYPTT